MAYSASHFFLKLLVLHSCLIGSWLAEPFTDLDMANAIGQLHAGFPQNQVTALFGVSTSIFSKLREMGCKVGVPVRQHKKTVSSFCQHVGTKGSLLHVCSQGLQDDMADDSLPRQARSDCTQPGSGLIRQPGLPFTIKPICGDVCNMCIRTWTCSVMSPDSAYSR